MSSEHDYKVRDSPRIWRARFCAMATLVASVAVCSGQDLPTEEPDEKRHPDKWGYNLFHPAPREFMREMSTDRPDQTESPFTVDAGHFQVEMHDVNATFDRDQSDGGDLETTEYALAVLNLKVGLLNNVDIQFVLAPYVHSRVEDRQANTLDENSGFGDFQTRVKFNLWGNDGGNTALAIMPFVKWPLPESGLRNGKTEGGVIFPFGLELGKGWGLGAMTEFDFFVNDTGGYQTEFVNSMTLGCDITHRFGMYVEFFSRSGSRPDLEWQGQVDVGWTWTLRANTVLDFGCNFGVTRSAPDFNPFVGLSFRF